MSPLSRASSEGFPKMGMGTHVLSFLISNHSNHEGGVFQISALIDMTLQHPMTLMNS